MIGSSCFVFVAAFFQRNQSGKTLKQDEPSRTNHDGSRMTDHQAGTF